MTDTLTDFDNWVETFKPIRNTLTDSASFDDGQGGLMFETYGPELDAVIAVANENPRKVWTWVDGDEGSYVIDGYHLVNRIGYFITEVPAELGKHYGVEV